MTETLTLEAIVEAGLCIGCGLCRSIAPDRIRMEMTAEGAEVPRMDRPLSPEEQHFINRVCPGLRAEGRLPEQLPATALWDVVWGPAMAMAKGHAADPELRFRGSAGGGSTALAIHLLESGEVDFILHVAASHKMPMRSEAHLSFSRADVLAGAGSRYGPAAPLVDLLQLLDRGRPFAVVAKPCDMSAIANLAREDARVDGLIRYRISLVCGGASAFSKTLDLARSFGLSEPDVAMLRYRGFGNPGRTRIEARDGRAFEVTYNDLWADEGKWRLFFRCKICGDAIGEMADIAISDVWPGGGPSGEDAGFNGFIARTARGAALLQRAAELGALTLLEDMGFRDFDSVQPHQLRKKQAVAARLTALRDAGLPATEFPGLRLEAAGETASAEFRRENYEGMRARLARRRLAEPD